MSAPSGPSEEALAAADELFEEFRLGSDSDIEPAAAIISKHLPVGELRECLREAYVIIEALRIGTTWEISPTIKSAMSEWVERAEHMLGQK